MIKAIFFDIDGTLRDFEEKGIPEYTRRALDMAREAGLRVCIATGRHWLEIEEEGLLGDLEFDAYVTLNGQLCYVREGQELPGRAIYKNPIDPGQVRRLLEMIEVSLDPDRGHSAVRSKILLTFGASGDTIEYAWSYMQIYSIGTIFVQLALRLKRVHQRPGVCPNRHADRAHRRSLQHYPGPHSHVRAAHGRPGAALATIFPMESAQALLSCSWCPARAI